MAVGIAVVAVAATVALNRADAAASLAGVTLLAIAVLGGVALGSLGGRGASR